MPIESTFPTEPSSPDQSQAKQCFACHCALSFDNHPLSPVPSPLFANLSLNDHPTYCINCRERHRERGRSLRERGVPVINPVVAHSVPPRSEVPHPPERNTDSKALHIDTQLASPYGANETHTTPSVASESADSPSLLQRRSTKSNIMSTIHTVQKPREPDTPHRTSPTSPKRRLSTSSVSQSGSISTVPPENIVLRRTPRPDPWTDITQIRVRSQGYGCLYPGAMFKGTQKSGRNSYDVNVTIVDVDFASSFLCGYLRIRGLTEDWPELTTYFDAEIIGSKYGFLTQSWGASEQEDMVHWARFPTFRNIQHELQKPHMTMKDRDRSSIFMRWKERFLVPDHRVQDINGASFAGFYYVCVDLNPHHAPTSPTRSSMQEMTTCPEEEVSPPDVHSFSSSPKPIPHARRSSISSPRRTRRPSSSRTRLPEEPIPTMCGFYFHQHSEPYQQLTLSYVKENTSSAFEFR